MRPLSNKMCSISNTLKGFTTFGFKMVRNVFKQNDNTYLGRWKLKHCNNHETVSVFWANSDHCGDVLCKDVENNMKMLNKELENSMKNPLHTKV